MATHPNWVNIVGSKTEADGGYAGDLLELAFIHLAKARDLGQLTDEMVGEVYAGTINSTFQLALNVDEVFAATAREDLKASLAKLQSGRL